MSEAVRRAHPLAVAQGRVRRVSWIRRTRPECAMCSRFYRAPASTGGWEEGGLGAVSGADGRLSRSEVGEANS
ncbi:hypothetical protein QF032_004744 [Streptomyces achromogenes]|nr:hypothetical protein [Streptomyces achromogenes]